MSVVGLVRDERKGYAIAGMIAGLLGCLGLVLLMSGICF